MGKLKNLDYLNEITDSDISQNEQVEMDIDLIYEELNLLNFNIYH